MACYRLKGGGFICGNLGPHCVNCGTVSNILCDYPVGEGGKTCDRQVCTECASEIAPDVHYCPGHYARWKEFREAGGVTRELSNVIHDWRLPRPRR